MPSIKDCVDEFAIDVDISDRNHLYDYANQQDIRRKEGESWDWSKITKLGGLQHIEDADESLMLQVSKMDKMFSDVGTFEKVAAEERKSDEDNKADEDDSSFDISDTKLDLPRRVLPVYGPGDVVKGQIVVKLNKHVEADKLTVNLGGSGVVVIRTYSQYGYYDSKSFDVFINKTKDLWIKSDDKETMDDLQNLVVNDNCPVRSKYLSEGIHKFPFEFVIPAETSQSCPNIHPNSHNYAFVTYRLKAQIDSGKWLGSDLVTHKGMWVVKPYDIASNPERLLPSTTEETLDTGLIVKSGRISLKATLPGKAFIKRESIPIHLEIDNQSKGAIEEVCAYINMQAKFRSSDCKLAFNKSASVKGRKLRETDIAAGVCPSLHWDLPWDFSIASVDSNLMPSGSLDDCKLIGVSYDVTVKVKRSGLHRNMVLEIPVEIGDYNSLK